MSTTAVELRGITKVFPPRTLAVDDVTLTALPAEIHAVVGENGAGKSTLMKILAGEVDPDAGAIHIQGSPYHPRGPRDAMAAGLGMVHQEILLVPEYTVWQNVVLGREPVGALGWIRVPSAREAVRTRIREYGLGLDPDARTADLSVAARQKVEILKLLYRDVRILILDEPTAVLAPQEVPQLFAEIRRLRDAGRTILLVSHRLDEVLDLADRVSVMRRGKVETTVAAAGTDRAELARMIVGREVGAAARVDRHPPLRTVLEASGLCTGDGRRPGDLKGVSLTVRAGEIVGVAGVEGNGQLDLVRVLVGLLAPAAGSVRVDGLDITRAPIRERRRWIAFVSQDRAGMGGSPRASVAETAVMTHHFLHPLLSRPLAFLRPGRIRAFAEELGRRLNVTMASALAPFRSLSGGNQQKIILGRELELGCPFVLLDQPTRGLDVGATESVRSTVLDMAARGRAVLLISAELEELVQLADRIVVLNRGRLKADMPADRADPLVLGRAMLGDADEGAHP